MVERMRRAIVPGFTADSALQTDTALVYMALDTRPDIKTGKTRTCCCVDWRNATTKCVIASCPPEYTTITCQCSYSSQGGDLAMGWSCTGKRWVIT